jgi:uncharacterized protein (TIGR00255 family)
MIHSMTGFASIGREMPNEMVHVTAKSVNHRFLDMSVKAPSALAALDTRIRALVQQRLTRGRVEVTIAAQVTTPVDREIVVDERLLERVAAAFETARARGLVTGHLTVSDALRIPQAFEIRAMTDGAPGGVPDGLAALVETVLGEALTALVAMRATEGHFLAADLESRVATIERFVAELEVESRDGQRRLEARLRERLADLPPDVQGEPAAVTREIVRFVSRSDVDEEITRMRSHVQHWRGLAAGPEPCGRKLDFLVQEMNREINTIGSKVESARASELVISAKAELERIREQVQNVE